MSVDADWQSGCISDPETEGCRYSCKQDSRQLKTYDYKGENDASHIVVPIYDVYNALISNSVIDISKFSDENASDTEKNLYARFQQKQQEVFDTITNRLTMDNPPAFKDESDEAAGVSFLYL